MDLIEDIVVAHDDRHFPVIAATAWTRLNVNES